MFLYFIRPVSKEFNKMASKFGFTIIIYKMEFDWSYYDKLFFLYRSDVSRHK